LASTHSTENFTDGWLIIKKDLLLKQQNSINPHLEVIDKDFLKIKPHPAKIFNMA